MEDQIKHAIAGCTAGLSTVLALQPLDVIKTRLQVQDGALGVMPVYKGTVDAVQHMLREEGWRSLYSGLTPALLGSGLAWGIYFFSYNKAKDRYQRKNKKPRLGPALHLLSAAEAGAVVCLATNPIWVVKTRLQLQYKAVNAAAAAAAAATTASSSATSSAVASSIAATASRVAGEGAQAAAATVSGAVAQSVPKAPTMYRGFLDCMTQIARQEGIAGLYKGLLPSLLLVSHGAIQFAVYEELKELASSIDTFITPLGSSSSTDAKGKRIPSSAEITACGALSKLAASLATYPSQVIRSRMQQRMDTRVLKYNGFVDVVKKTMAREGVKGFYRGLIPHVLRVMPQSAITFLVYESVMHYLNNVKLTASRDERNKK